MISDTLFKTLESIAYAESLEISLIDGVAQSREHPDTFQVPSEEDKRDIRPGYSVKFAFVVADDAPGERMWVDVTAVNGDHITGLLASDPMFLPLERDDIITGTLANVLDIRDAKAYRPPEADAPQPSGLH